MKRTLKIELNKGLKLLKRKQSKLAKVICEGIFSGNEGGKEGTLVCFRTNH